MIRTATAAALLCACALASASDVAPAGEARLAVRLRPDPVAAGAALSVDRARTGDAPPPPCVGDWCQMRVDVPGIALSRGRPSKTELFVALMDRAQIEPVASVAWFFLATGLRVDWTPANMDESFGATAGGWGNVFVRLRLRIDAWNRPAVPMRPRERMRQDRELAAERARALEAERLRALVPQRPARRSST